MPTYRNTGRDNWNGASENRKFNSGLHGKTVLTTRQPDRFVAPTAWCALAVLTYFAVQFAR